MNTRPWYGIAFSLGGELIYCHNSDKIPLEGKKIVFLPKNATYDVCCTKTGAFALINFLTASDLDIHKFISTSPASIEAFRDEFRTMHNLFSFVSTQNKYSNISSLYKILSALSGGFSERRMPPMLSAAINYISDNIGLSSLSNTRIASSLGISEVYLRKLFSENLSVSPNLYIQKKRIEKSKKLLIETNLSVTEISDKCGFSCIYYFCNMFKNKTGRTPTQYRKNNSFDFF